MPTPEAPIVLQFKDGEKELPLDRTIAYTYREMGHAAINHLWIENEIQPEGGDWMGERVWYDQFGATPEERAENWQTVLQGMLNYGYMMLLNLKEPHESDIEAFVTWQASLLDRGWD